ncbi:type IV secretory system conjugative DNA transfer family protein [Phenylobacterium sp. J367]|nr:type IV secretory system conjugative DNA transfer family protein [Phenylobacterium sp. J367]MCR5879659.1 type IV secretory system conjugative DNA transfer family protein [Phenylobacterium sp. J367]
MSRFAHTPWPLRALFAGGGALLALGVAAGLAVAIALAGLGRLSPNLDPAAVPAWLWYYRFDPDVQRWLKVGALSAAGLTLITTIGLAAQIRRPLHGAARWANEAEIRRAGLRARTGILLGRKGGRLLTFGGQEHVVLYAPTRTGKGVGVVIPNLLTWPGSVVVLDVKRENWQATAGFRAAHGQQVFLFDPLDPEGRTARYNPLGHIDRTDPAAILDDLQRIAAMLFPHPANADPFWAESARVGFIGVGALLAETPERPLTFGGIYAELTAGDPRTRLPALVAQRQRDGRPLSAGCVRAVTDFTASSENTFASVRQSLTAKLNLWLNPRVRAATAHSDFDLAALRSRPTSIYLAASPDNLARLAPLYALLFQQLVDRSCRELPDPAQSPPPGPSSARRVRPARPRRGAGQGLRLCGGLRLAPAAGPAEPRTAAGRIRRRRHRGDPRELCGRDRLRHQGAAPGARALRAAGRHHRAHAIAQSPERTLPGAPQRQRDPTSAAPCCCRRRSPSCPTTN